MKRQFLVGNFLPAYQNAYRYREGYGRRQEPVDASWLERRFADRTAKRRGRGQEYLLRIQLAMVAALLVAIAATTVDFEAGSSFDVSLAERETVTLQEIAQTVQNVIPPPPPKPAVPIVVRDDEILADDELDLDAALDLTETVAAIPPPPPVEEEEEDEEIEPEIFVIVEEQPEMIGGVAGLARDLVYPEIARRAGIEGMVIVKVVVTADGLPDRPVVVKSPSSVLDGAAIDAVMKQRFKPGRQRGRAVAVEMAIPVDFQLTG